MAEQFQNAKSNLQTTTYTCPSGSSALVLGITVRLSTTATIVVSVQSAQIFSVSLPAGTHNITHYCGKITLASGENISVENPASTKYTVISALRIY